MHLFRVALISSVLVLVLLGGALGATVIVARQTAEPLRLALPMSSSHEAMLYVGYDPGLSCTVGEQRAVGLSLVDTTSHQSTRLIAIPIGP